MKNNKKIVFFVDHKHRDLLSIIKICLILKKKKFKFKIYPQWDFEKINKFNPKLIVLGKNNIHDFEKIRWKLEDRKTISIPNENFHLRNIDKVIFPCDLNFYWNKNTLKQQIKIDGKKIVCGCPRTDFLKKINFKNNKCITFALPPTKSELKNKNELIKFSRNQGEKIVKGKNNVLGIEDIPRGRNIAMDMIKWSEKLAVKYKKLTFILKVHPNDVIKYWLTYKKNNKIKNLKVMYGKNIYDLLKISKLHIAAEGCTTTFEAIESNVPTAEIVNNSKLTKKIFFNHQLNICKNKINNINDLEKLIMINKTIYFSSNKKNYIEYVKNNFYKIDGKRCYEYAENIEKFSNNVFDNFFLTNLKNVCINLIKINKANYWIFFLKLIIKKIIYKNISYPKFMHIKLSKQTRVDNSGKFDSRVTQKDISKTLKKFRVL